jgi:hypothetical protein
MRNISVILGNVKKQEKPPLQGVLEGGELQAQGWVAEDEMLILGRYLNPLLNIEESPASGNIEPEFFSVTLHGCPPFPMKTSIGLLIIRPLSIFLRLKLLQK